MTDSANPAAAAEEPLVIPLRIGWGFKLAAAACVALTLWVVASPVLFALGLHAPKQPHLLWLSTLIGGTIALGCDVLVFATLRRHSVTFEPRHLLIESGVHTERIAYTGIRRIQRTLPALTAYAWRPTGPDPLRIHHRLGDESISVHDKDQLISELVRRNPRIAVID